MLHRRDGGQQRRSCGIGSVADGPAGRRRGGDGQGRRRRAAGTNVSTTDQDQERNQRLWWYLLFAGLVLLAIETFIGNRVAHPGRVQAQRPSILG